MIKKLKLSCFCIFVFINTASCSSSATNNFPAAIEVDRNNISANSFIHILKNVEDNAPEDGRRVLEMARQMTLIDKVILPGGCWDYVNAVFQRAGYSEKNRVLIFKGTKSNGPYAKINDIQAGDWLYFINHSYHDIEHSSMFVAWTDKVAHKGLMLSYSGEKRQEPARYREYDLSHVYRIYRPKSEKK